jgi:hypothetical protein
MPFEAAKAVAATFCWKIRFALTPLFGPDFPSMCILPEEKARFGRMIIDSAIVKEATESARYFRTLELESKFTPAAHHRHSDAPAAGTNERLGKNILPKPQKCTETASEDDVDSDERSSGCPSPPTTHKSAFTTDNVRRSSKIAHRGFSSPQEILASLSSVTRLADSGDDDSSNSESSSSDSGEVSCTGLNMDVDSGDKSSEDGNGDYHMRDGSAASITPPDQNPSGQAPRSRLLTREVSAAHALLSLHTREGDLAELADKQKKATNLRNDHPSRGHRRESAEEHARKRRHASA